jgi:hypothetical protein
MLDKYRKMRTGEKRNDVLTEFRDERRNSKLEGYTSYNLQVKNDIESYEKIMGSNPNYLFIFYILVQNYKQNLKDFVFTKIKIKILTRNNNNKRVFIIVLTILFTFLYFSYY